MIGALFRLGFVAACCAFVYGLILLAGHESVAVAVIVGVVGVVVAVVLSEDWSDRPPAAPGRRPGRARAPWPWKRTGPYEGE